MGEMGRESRTIKIKERVRAAVETATLTGENATTLLRAEEEAFLGAAVEKVTGNLSVIVDAIGV
jgi:hypothetical protein